MKDNNNEQVIDGVQTETVETGAATETTSNEPETITLTQDEYNKLVQSAGDKVRTKYNNKIKELEARINALTPVEKTQQEIDYENRLAELEARERAVALNEALEAKGIDKNLAKYLKSDVNVDDLASVIDGLVSAKSKANTYVPSGHLSGETLTKDEFKKMTMDAKERLYAENPEIYRALASEVRKK